jgi:carboxylesterase
MNEKPVIYQHPELDGKSFYLPGKNANGSTGLLFLHGFTATTVEVRQTANYFNMLGYTVSGPLLPGHGTMPENLNGIHMEEWLKTASEAYANLWSNTNNVYIFGESMGALLTIYLANRNPQIKRIFLFSPALIIDGLWKARFAWPFKSHIYKKNTDDSMLWQGYNVVPLHGAVQLLRLQQLIKKVLPSIKTDTIIFQGKKDKTINLSSSTMVFEQLGSTKKQLIWLEDSTHCILLDRELPIVLDQCLKSIQEDD